MLHVVLGGEVVHTGLASLITVLRNFGGGDVSRRQKINMNPEKLLKFILQAAEVK